MTDSAGAGIRVAEAAARSVQDVLDALHSGPRGLSASEARERLAVVGPNAVRSHHVRVWAVLGRQLRSALLLLLAATAALSFAFGERAGAVIIGVILVLSVLLGFANELRAEKAAEALHSRVRHTTVVLRAAPSRAREAPHGADVQDARSVEPDETGPAPAAVEVDVTELVPGDVVRLTLGQVVPADLRLLECTAFACDESVLTGESAPVDKSTAPVPEGVALAELTSCALMGTVVHAGAATAVVVATGGDAEFGRIALGLGERQPETDFQTGLRRFSMLLLKVAVVLTTAIFAINLVLQRPLLDALLFSLAIAVGITPQLLPAVVSTSLATGSRQLAKRKVLVKRLVCIEDLGDMDVLVTDKTGTLTEGRISFQAALDPVGTDAPDVLRLGLLATEGEPGGDHLGGNPLDSALWQAEGAAERTPDGVRRLAVLPFDHERQLTSTLLQHPDGSRLLVAKGAPEQVLARCLQVPEQAAAVLKARFAAGSRVVAVATKDAGPLTGIAPGDESGLRLAGFLVFLDPPKAGAADSLRRLAGLGITVKICTGDNALVAQKVCADLGLPSGRALTGRDIEAMDDAQLTEAAEEATVFARVSPQDKARIVGALRRRGRDIGFLGDGVNDALALHAADVGISVDTATDVAKDAADVLLLEKDLGVLADGVAEGRRIFANTIKYVLMGTSSNFGNMFSAAGASLVLSFLPMLPSQILLNNLLYDASQLTIPTDHVDEEQLRAPSHWDIGFIRRFMLVFGPVSSAFDFLTFWVMIGIFHAGPALFRSGWFVESLATQTLVIFAIRTRRVPFFRSRPSRPLLAAALGVVALGVALPMSPLADTLGFQALPVGFFLALAVMTVLYVALIEAVKQIFFSRLEARPTRPRARTRTLRHRIQRRAARFSHRGPLPPQHP
ncbi:magnesium-translocating P-type ATPase [Streptomyces sp. H10-C2]|uniref:magnesium-translocating P-type ATPase n=1 Tax=unclassified Streptomyces TaxID=2593676 RepID=UPI0024BB5CFA|nr:MULTISPECIES: magnesium-translocating P-type ATPase [unclassified Streptomyces]MDJ0344726.1 magnesium-translocating P-type ATPase [Streptomyces sp. PH10-H1]MDJ0371215.1 magnesium-translocating P-type ATPase [Streptomyces sp. H10-C2]